MRQLKRNALHMCGSQLLVALFQGLQFILIARALGAYDFGRMAGILAMTGVMLPFSGLGAENVIVIRLARGTGNARVYFGNALLVAVISGLLLVLLYILWGVTFLPTLATLQMLVIFGVSEILVTKLIDIAAHVFFGFDRHVYSGFFYSLHGFLRLLFASVFFALLYHNAELLNKLQLFSSFIIFPGDRLELWCWFHLAAGLTTLVFVLFITIRQIGWPTFDLMLAFRELRIGVFYSIGLSSKSVYINIDKTILARYVSPEINGAYTAAFRLIYMAYTPIQAILSAASARFFRDGASGVGPPFRMATRIVIYGSMYCLVFAMLVFIGAPLIPYLLGDGYALSTDILRWLALLPLILMLQDTYSDALTGADRQMARSFFQVIVALMCFTANMALVPKFSWRGAVCATYFSQIVLAILVMGLIVLLLRRERTGKYLKTIVAVK
ncbi:lipopolysaccharide biosynthesis protein [Candidatus Methylobacter favarea]|nr:oligosaccharide flippase family protein [Candidatus Methylobacter favarea]